jgi:hypothetical protein
VAQVVSPEFKPQYSKKKKKKEKKRKEKQHGYLITFYMSH